MTFMQFSSGDAVRVGDVLAQAARAHIMPRFRTLLDENVREKSSSFDVVREADEAAEQAIVAMLKASFPAAIIVGEESAAKNPAILQKIATADLAFIIDPIDGTKNFVAGLPLFGVMAAATIRGEVVLSAIHDPECSETAFALRGEGAWRQGDGRARTALKVASAVPGSTMAAIPGPNFMPEPLRATC